MVTGNAHAERPFVVAKCLAGIASTAMIATLAACNLDMTPIGAAIMGAGAGPECPSCQPYEPSGPWIEARPTSILFLHGDTARFTATRCETNGSCKTTYVRWSLADSSIAAIVSASPIRPDSAQSILVRARAPGSTKIFATALGSNLSFQGLVYVEDSSAIKELRVMREDRLDDSLKVGRTAGFTVRLLTGLMREVHAVPTALSVSDTAALRITSTLWTDFGFRINVLALKSGRADFRLQFLGLTRSVPLTVVP